jgi:integrase
MGLGSVRDVDLAAARKKAQKCREQLDAGIDPLDARNAKHAQDALTEARSISFGKCAESYIAAHRAGWRNPKHADQWANTIKSYAGPVIGALPVQDVDTGLVCKVLEPIWTKKAETASRLRARIEKVLDWATVRGYRNGANPATWRGHMDKLLPALKKKDRVKHHPALQYESIGAFMEALRAQEGTAARALELTILTAARTSEVIGAKPDEIDLKRALWTIPASRMKAGREHRVPLSPRAVEIVKAQPEGDYLFPGLKDKQPLSNMAMLALLERMERSDLTVHGFRSSFRDWTAEQTNYPREVCEMALAHAVGDKVEAAYRRGDLFEKRRRLMLEWAKYCERRATGGKGAKVIKIVKAA